MSSVPSVETWNRTTVALVQALVGAVSDNFRQVTLGHGGRHWELGFVLARESADDREEILDIACEFEALFDGPVDYELVIEVSAAEIPMPVPPARAVFRRRE